MKRDLTRAEGTALEDNMTVEIYANEVKIPDDQIENYSITNKEFLALLDSVRARILRESESD